MPATVTSRRDVVSFVRRSTRMRPQQWRDLQTHGPTYVLDVPRGPTSTSVAPGYRLDLTEAYGRDAPLVVEVGPGTGESLVPMAAARPELNLLAFEVYQPGIARTVGQLARGGVDNVRLAPVDAAAGFGQLLGENSVAEVWTFFPDPWPKARHHKRRLVGPAFADLVASRLRPGGRWRLATDWEDYADAIREVLDAIPGLTAVGAGGTGRWAERPVTRFERRGLAAGRAVVDLTYRRR